MPRKRKVKKQEAALNPESQRKIALLEDLLVYLDEEEKNYERLLQSIASRNMTNIRYYYDHILRNMDDNMKTMTIAQLQESIKHQEKEELPPKMPLDNFSSEYERTKMVSEKKKTIKKDRKRSFSANSSNKYAPFAFPSTKKCISRTVSESDLHTPNANKLGCPTPITPKFDIKSTNVNRFARKPKAGEVILSLSGSPLKNTADQIKQEKPVPVGLFNGKVVSLTLHEVEDVEKGLQSQSEQALNDIMQNIQQKLIAINMKGLGSV